MRASIFFGICLGVAACGFGGGLWYSGYLQPVSEVSHHAQIPDRIIPEDADFGAYLAGLLARDNQDVSGAATYYKRVYEKDPDNKEVRLDLYLIAGLSGDVDTFLNIAQSLKNNKNAYYAPLFLAANAVKKEEYAKALEVSPALIKTGSMQKILYPVIRAWSYAGQGKLQQAFNALLPLKRDETNNLYWYQRAMIAAYLKDVSEAHKAFEQLAELDMPTVTALQAARWFYKSQNNWTVDNPLYHKYFKTIQDNQALSEILITRADEFDLKTPAQGVADIFFMVSTLIDERTHSAETGLLFNQIAIYLDDQSSVYKIWGAEQFEGVKYYAEANRLYDSLSKPSHTILFKKALNLMLMENTKEAEKIFSDLSIDLPHDKTLGTMMGNLYRDAGRFNQAIEKYSMVLNQADEKDSPETLAGLYFSRAAMYEGIKNKTNRDNDLQSALALTPNNSEILNYQGYVWIDEQKNIPRAMTYILQAHKLSPKEPHIWDSLAWGYYRQGELQKALYYAERAADGMPFSAVVQMHLGDIYGALGRKREAGYQYHKALNLKADMTDALKAELTQKLENNQ